MASNAETIFDNILSIYKSSKDKGKQVIDIIEYLYRVFTDLDPDTIYEVKVLMETQFMRVVDCPVERNSPGCDLREMLFHSAEVPFRDQILSLINTKTLGRRIPHILTDIDDTLFSVGKGDNISFWQLSGSDVSWNYKQAYPGLKKFYQLFYKNIDLETARYSTVLSGTPATMKKTRVNDVHIKDIIGPNFGFMHGYEGKTAAIKSVLKGWFSDLTKAAPPSNDVARLKSDKFKEYIQIYPEYDILFIGDNGQGDLIAGKEMIRTHRNTQVFIHNILKGKKSESEFEYMFSPEDEVAQQAEVPAGRLFFFKNYLELGYIFHTLSIFTADDFMELKQQIADDISADIPADCNPDELQRCSQYKKKYQFYVCPKPGYPENVCIQPSQIKKRKPNGGTRKRRSKTTKLSRRVYRPVPKLGTP